MEKKINRNILSKVSSSMMLIIIVCSILFPLFSEINIYATSIEDVNEINETVNFEDSMSNIKSSEPISIDMSNIDWDILETGDTVSTVQTTIDSWNDFIISSSTTDITQNGLDYDPSDNSFLINGSNTNGGTSTEMYLKSKYTIDTNFPYFFSLGYDLQSPTDLLGVFTTPTNDISSTPGYGTNESIFYGNYVNGANNYTHKIRYGGSIQQSKETTETDFNTIEFNVDPKNDYVEVQSCKVVVTGDRCEEASSVNQFPEIGESGSENEAFDPVTDSSLDNEYTGMRVKAGQDDKTVTNRSLSAKFNGVSEIQTDFDNMTVEAGTSIEEIHEYLDPKFYSIEDYIVIDKERKVPVSNLDTNGYDPDAIGEHFLFTYKETSSSGKTDSSTSVDVYIRDPETDAELNVSSKNVLISEAPQTEKELQQTMDVYATEPNGSNITNQVDVISIADYDGYDFDDPKVGTYQITYYVIGESNEAIYNHKTGELTIVEDEGSTEVSANNITVDITDLESMDDKDIIKASDAHAYVIDGDGVEVFLDEFQVNDLLSATGEGVYPITIYADNASDAYKVIYVTIEIEDKVSYEVQKLNNYNVILQGDLEAEMADSEGAIAVKGDVYAPSEENQSYSVGAANSSYSYGQHIGLPFSESDGPAILLGGSVSKVSPKEKLVVLGNSIINEGTSSDYTSQIDRDEFTYDITEYPQSEIYDIIDNFFVQAQGFIDIIKEYEPGDVFTDAGTPDYYQYNDMPEFTINEVEGVSGISLSEIPGNDITISEYNITSEVLEQDIIVFYSDATSVEYKPGAATIDGEIIDTNALYNQDAIDTSSNYIEGNLMEEIASKSVWVFPNATDITIDNYAVIGTVIAPNADIVGNGGAINGQIIATDLTQNGGFEAHNFPLDVEFTGRVSLHKTDQNGQDLEGVEFVIKDSEGEIYDTQVSNKFGYVEFSDLPFGEYTIEESKTLDGYLLIDEPIEVIINPLMDNITYDVMNYYEEGTLAINKLDSNDQSLIAGAEFTIFDEDDKCIIDEETEECYVLKTDDNGYLEFTNLDFGTYYVVETKTPSGYIPSDEKYSFEVNESSHDIINTIYNNHYGEMELLKTDRNTGEPLEGVEFTIYDENDAVVKVLTTDENGYIFYDKLDYGFYKIEETSVPEGYEDPTWLTYFVINDAKYSYEWNVTNEYEIGEFSIVKSDATNEDIKLEGVTFDVFNEENELVDQLTTDEKGEATTIELPFGKYTLVETSTASGYLLDNEPITITLNGDTNKEVYKLVNDEEIIVIDGSVSLTKVDSENSNIKLENVKFGIYDSEDKLIESKFTDEDGFVEFINLEEGTYFIKEISTINGYALSDEVIEVNVTQSAQNFEFTIENSVNVGGFTLKKYDSLSQIYLKDAEFTLYDLEKNEITTETTDENGEIKFEDLEYGTYILVETKAPEDYVVDSSEYYVSIDRDNHDFVFDFANDSNRVADRVIAVRKIDKQTGEALAGAEFEVLDSSNNVVSSFTTDENGYGQSDVLDVDFTDEIDDEFTLVEVNAPDGYLTPNWEYDFALTKDNESVVVEIANDKENGTANVLKIDGEEETPISGTTFSLYKDVDENGAVDLIDILVDELITDENGEIAFDELEFAHYVLVETESAEGYVLDDQVYSFELNENVQTVSFEIENSTEKGYLQIIKVDADDNKIRLEGVTYDIIGISDPTFILEDQVTAKTGAISTPLPLGEYQVIEKSVEIQENGQEYVVDSTPYTIDITENNEIITYTQTNQKVKEYATISVDKTSTELIEDPNNEGEFIYAPLEGVEFCVYGSDPTVQDISAIECVLTNEDGYAEFSALELEDYYVKENNSIQGYYTSADITRVELDTEDENVNLDFMNEIISVETQITKKDGESDEVLTGATFDMYLDVNKNGEIDSGDEIIFENETTDSDGVLTIEFGYENPIIDSDGLANSYLLKENQAPEGYYVSDEVLVLSYSMDNFGELIVNPDSDFEISNRIPIGEINENTGSFAVLNEVDFYNDMIFNDFDLVKTSNYDDLVEGATYCIYNDEPSDESELDCQTTDENGELTFSDIPAGTYYVKESSSPNGYYLDTNIYTVISSSSGVVIENDEDGNGVLDVVDEIHEFNVEFKKVNSNTKDTLVGAEFNVVQDTNGNEILDASDKIMYNNVVTDSDGSFELVFDEEFRMIDSQGYSIGYFITETKAPEGYVLNGSTYYYTFALGNDGQYVIDDEVNLSAESIVMPEGNDNPVIEISNDEYLETVSIVKKSDSNQLLSGATYCIYSDEELTTELECVTTDDRGEATFDFYNSGVYYIKESVAPIGYYVDDTVYEYEFSSGGTQDNNIISEVEYIDYEYEGEITVTKRDVITDEVLSGAEFMLVQDSNTDGEFNDLFDIILEENVITDENGEISFEVTEDLDLINDLGNYNGFFLIETKAPDGYERNDEPYYFSVKFDENGSLVESDEIALEADRTISENTEPLNLNIDFYNNAKSGNIDIHKIDQFDNDIMGVEFCIYDQDPSENDDLLEIECVESEEDGMAYFDNLELGTYYIKEIRTAYGHFLSDVVIEVVLDDSNYKVTHEIEVLNRLFDPEISVKKVDSETGEVLEGAQFNVYQDTNGNKDLDDEDILMEEALTTGEDGTVKFVFNSEFKMVDEDGKSIGYFIKETFAPEGYVLEQESIYVTFSIDENGEIIFNPEEGYVAPVYIVDPSTELAFTYVFDNTKEDNDYEDGDSEDDEIEDGDSAGSNSEEQESDKKGNVLDTGFDNNYIAIMLCLFVIINLVVFKKAIPKK